MNRADTLALAGIRARARSRPRRPLLVRNGCVLPDGERARFHAGRRSGAQRPAVPSWIVVALRPQGSTLRSRTTRLGRPHAPVVTRAGDRSGSAMGCRPQRRAPRLRARSRLHQHAHGWAGLGEGVCQDRLRFGGGERLAQKLAKAAVASPRPSQSGAIAWPSSTMPSRGGPLKPPHPTSVRGVSSRKIRVLQRVFSGSAATASRVRRGA